MQSKQKVKLTGGIYIYLIREGEGVFFVIGRERLHNAYRKTFYVALEAR